MDCSLLGSSIHGILQARILEWVAMISSRGSSPSRDPTCISYISCNAGRFFTTWGFPDGSDGKESACNARDPGSISGSGRCPGEGNGNPPQYFCLENSMDGGAWQATVHGVIESDTTEQLTLLLHFMTSIQET